MATESAGRAMKVNKSEKYKGIQDKLHQIGAADVSDLYMSDLILLDEACDSVLEGIKQRYS